MASMTGCGVCVPPGASNRAEPDASAGICARIAAMSKGMRQLQGWLVRRMAATYTESLLLPGAPDRLLAPDGRVHGNQS
ncbi:hypothetical protein GCM10010431_66710 [Streptomyces kunmingensis]